MNETERTFINFDNLSDDALVKTGVVAKLLSVTTATVRNLVKREVLKPIMVTPNSPRFRVGDLRTFLKEGCK